jgi:hypothetical protein
MGFYNSLKSQIGRDTGRAISNALLGDRQAIRFKNVDSNNAKANLQAQKDYELEMFELEKEKNKERAKIYELRERNVKIERGVANLISMKIPQRKEDLIDLLNELSMIISAHSWKFSEDDENEQSNKYSDAALKKFEQCLFILKNKFPKEFEIIYFEKQFKKFKRKAFISNNYIIHVMLMIFFIGLIVIVGCYSDKHKPKETPIKDFFHSVFSK